MISCRDILIKLIFLSLSTKIRKLTSKDLWIVYCWHLIHREKRSFFETSGAKYCNVLYKNISLPIVIQGLCFKFTKLLLLSWLWFWCLCVSERLSYLTMLGDLMQWPQTVKLKHWSSTVTKLQVFQIIITLSKHWLRI